MFIFICIQIKKYRQEKLAYWQNAILLVDDKMTEIASNLFTFNQNDELFGSIANVLKCTSNTCWWFSVDFLVCHVHWTLQLCMTFDASNRIVEFDLGQKGKVYSLLSQFWSINKHFASLFIQKQIPIIVELASTILHENRFQRK